VLAFYFSLLPQFVDQGTPTLPQVLILAATHAGLALVWLLIVVIVLDRIRTFLQRPRVHQTVQGLTGVALIGLGVKLATASARG
jgi:threonine/homoserine/homoserine lactone efflux protein